MMGFGGKVVDPLKPVQFPRERFQLPQVFVLHLRSRWQPKNQIKVSGPNG